MKLIIIDIDNTLFDNRKRADYLLSGDYESYDQHIDQDVAVPEIADLLFSLSNHGWSIAGITNRNERHRSATLKLCLRYGLAIDYLVMRKDDDYSKVQEVKIAMARQAIREANQDTKLVTSCLVILDGRDDVAAEFRTNKFIVMQVGMRA